MRAFNGFSDLRHVVQQDWVLVFATHSSGKVLSATKAVDNFVGNFVSVRHEPDINGHQIFRQASRKKYFLAYQ